VHPDRLAYSVSVFLSLSLSLCLYVVVDVDDDNDDERLMARVLVVAKKERTTKLA